MKPTWKKYLLYGTVVIIGGGLIIALIRLILLGYTVAWTGFGDYAPPNSTFVRGKTLWNWMELLIIPLVLAGGALYLQRSERVVERRSAEDRAKLEREIATDRQQEAALQTYLDQMTDLLLNQKLRTSKNKEIRNVARIRTLTVLIGLNAGRKGSVLLFLKESGLIDRQAIINLSGANLIDIYLEEGNLEGVNLSGANLSGANLRGADLSGANLSKVTLSSANLVMANLQGANLSESDLNTAALDFANVSRVDLTGATLNAASLSNADVSESNLSRAELTGADLSLANLGKANLSGAYLLAANISEADLSGASLNSAYLTGGDEFDCNLNGVYLDEADLTGALVNDSQLAMAQSLKGAILPDGKKHD